MRIFALFAFHSHRSHYAKGFTLLEMLISLGIFSILIIAAIGITIGVSQAQLKAANIQAIQDNIRFGLELMTKELRTGTNYRTTPSATACAPDGEGIRFTTSLNEDRIYFRSLDGKLMRYTIGVSAPGPGIDCTKAIPISADEVSVDVLKLRLLGGVVGPNDGQPVITVSLRVSSRGAKFGPETNMNLQTTVVPRLRDL